MLWGIKDSRKDRTEGIMFMRNECMFDVMGMSEICRGQEIVKRKELGILTIKERHRG